MNSEFNRILSNLGFELKSTKTAILEIVLKHYPIKAKNIQEKLFADYKKEITLPAVLKNLEKLVNEGWLLTKRDSTFFHPYYVPNINWLLKTSSMFYSMYEKFNSEETSPLKRICDIGSMDAKPFQGIAKSVSDFETWVIEFEKEEKENVISAGRHFWWMIAYPDLSGEMIRKNKQRGHEIIGICSENNLIARAQMEKGKKDLSINLKVIPTANKNPYIYVFGDYVIFAYYPEEINNIISEYFCRFKRIDEVPKKEIERLLNENHSVPYVGVENKEFANSIKDSLKKYNVGII